MIKISRIVVGSDKTYQSVQLLDKGELESRQLDAAKHIPPDKLLAFNQPGTRRQPNWIFLSKNNVLLLYVDPLRNRGGTGVAFERVVFDSSSFGPGRFVDADGLVDAGVPQELLDLAIFDNPVAVIVQEGLILSDSSKISHLHIANAQQQMSEKTDLPPVVSVPLAEAKAQRDAARFENGGVSPVYNPVPGPAAQGSDPERGVRHETAPGIATISEVATNPDGTPVSRDLTVGVVEDPGPGRRGGAVNPGHEFNPNFHGERSVAAEEVGTSGGLATPEQDKLAGEPGAGADRALGAVPGGEPLTPGVDKPVASGQFVPTRGPDGAIVAPPKVTASDEEAADIRDFKSKLTTPTTVPPASETAPAAGDQAKVISPDPVKDQIKPANPLPTMDPLKPLDTGTQPLSPRADVTVKSPYAGPDAPKPEVDKPAVIKPAEVKAEPPKPAEVKPETPKPVEVKPEAPKPADPKPAAKPVKPADPKPKPAPKPDSK